MATVVTGVTVGNGEYRIARPADLAGTLPSQTALDDAMAVLQADGAAPTEAHVDTADAAWIAYKAALAAAVTGADGDFVLTYDDTVQTTLDKLSKSFQALRKYLGIPG